MSEVIAIVGSRSLPSEAWPWVKQVLEHELAACREWDPFDPNAPRFISGGARGADTMARRWVNEHLVGLTFFDVEPDYDAWGDRAPLVRDDFIAERCTRLIALADERITDGTGYTIGATRRLGKPVKVYTYSTQRGLGL